MSYEVLIKRNEGQFLQGGRRATRRGLHNPGGQQADERSAGQGSTLSLAPACQLGHMPLQSLPRGHPGHPPPPRPWLKLPDLKKPLEALLAPKRHDFKGKYHFYQRTVSSLI